MPMPILPPEVWIHIAQFIPQGDLCSMISVNSTFFHLAMDAKYHEVEFYDFNNARKLMDMVSPTSRAIRFSVREKLGDVHDATAFEREGIRRLRDPLIAHRVRYLRVIFGMKERERFEEVDKKAMQHIWSSLQNTVRVMTETVSYLTNVTMFTVHLWHLPIPPEDLIPLFTTAWKTFGCSLRTIHLYMKPTYLFTLLPTIDCLQATSLEEVGVGLTKLYHERYNPRLLYRTMVATAFAPFINKFAPTLRSLTFGAWMDSGDLELWPVFPCLDNIPNLERLTLCMDCAILSDPYSFILFLRNHATILRHLHLSMNPKGSTLSPRRWRQSAARWLMRSQLDGIVFANLCSLEIAVPRPAGIALIMELITHSTDRLTKLVILNFSMSYDEVDTLVSSFLPYREGSLQEFHLEVDFLSPELVLLLAQKLPRLKTLRLEIRNVAARNGLGEIAPTSRMEELSNARGFAAAMRTCDVNHWGLQNITIGASQCRDCGISWKLMREFVDWVPSLQTFGGEDKVYMQSLPAVLKDSADNSLKCIQCADSTVFLLGIMDEISSLGEAPPEPASRAENVLVVSCPAGSEFHESK